VRGATNFSEIQLRYPLGKKPRKLQMPKGIYAKLNEQIVRDIDVVTRAKTVTTTQTVRVTNQNGHGSDRSI